MGGGDGMFTKSIGKKTMTEQETETTRIFRRVFIENFQNFKKESAMMANGNANFNDNWVDTAGKEGLAISTSVIVGIIALLGALGILSAVASAGAVIPIAILGVVGGIAFYKYRNYIKHQRFQRAAELFAREDIDAQIEEIADLLMALYAVQLKCCTVNDAEIFAESCVKAFSEEIMRNKNFNFNDLLNSASLQGALMGSMSRIAKVSMDMNIRTRKTFNLRGMITHAAYYCKENNEYYQTSQSKPTKYGVLLFEKESDIADYESIITTSLRGGEKWRLSAMRPHEVSNLVRSSMFRAYKNEDVFTQDKQAIVPIKNDGP